MTKPENADEGFDSSVCSSVANQLARKIEDEIYSNDRGLWERIAGKQTTASLSRTAEHLLDELRTFAETGCLQIRCDERIGRGVCLTNQDATFVWVHPDEYETTRKRLAEAFSCSLKKRRKDR
jgi:hypothetical protein